MISARGAHGTEPSTAALECGHETTDINVRTTVYILAGMAAVTALVIGVVFVMVWRSDASRHAAWSGLTNEQTAVSVPPTPRLQSHPFIDLAQQKARQQRLLHSYGWINADHTTARIPIDRAMALSVGKALDAWP